MLKNFVTQFGIKGKVVDRLIVSGNITAMHFEDGDVLLLTWSSSSLSVLKEQDVANLSLRTADALKLFREAPSPA